MPNPDKELTVSNDTQVKQERRYSVGRLRNPRPEDRRFETRRDAIAVAFDSAKDEDAPASTVAPQQLCPRCRYPDAQSCGESLMLDSGVCACICHTASASPASPAAPVLHCSCGAACTPDEYAAHRAMGHDAPAALTSSDAWTEWFNRLGEKASADVVNATANLVTDERLAALVQAGVLPNALRDEAVTFALLGYEHALTIGWNEHNARRHELIEAKRSRTLSESEISELAELQWLAGIKRALLNGPTVTRDEAEQCSATCADFPMYSCEIAHRCVLDAGHPFDPFHSGGVHEFETHQTTVKPRR